MYRKVILSAENPDDVMIPKLASYQTVDDQLICDTPHDVRSEPEEPERISNRGKVNLSKAENKKPKAEQQWREVADAVDRMLPAVPLGDIADNIDMDKDTLTALVTERELWEVFLRFTPDGDYMTNWLTSQHDYGSQTEVVAATREIIKVKFTLRLYFSSVSGFEFVMNKWIAAFVAHCRSNALFNWILHKERFYVQMGQTTPQQLLPPKEDFNCAARMSFKEWDEYCLIQGFQILEGMEVASKIDNRIPDVMLRLMHMPGARNKSQPTCTRAYFAVICETDASNEDESTTRLSDLKEGEYLGVCFETHRDSRLEDWRAIVVSTVDGNRDEYIVALIRPFDKVKGKYADIPLEPPEPIHLGKVKDRNDLRQKLISQDGYLVNIYREDTAKDHQRALQALGEITDNKNSIWNDRRKMLLMSNFGPKAPLINFFATLSPAAHDKVFIDLYAVCNLEQKAALSAMRAVPHGIFILPGCGGSGKTWLCMRIIMMLIFQEVMKVEGETETIDMDTTKLCQSSKIDTSEKTFSEKSNEATTSTTGKTQPKSYEEKFTATHASTKDEFVIPNKHQVLFVVCLNKTLNDSIDRLNKDLQKAAQNTNNPEPIVVRAYSAHTDKKIYQHEAKKRRLANPHVLKRPFVSQNDELEELQQDILELDHVRDLMDSFKTHTKKRHGASDPRLGDVALSLGYWVLVLTGLLPEKTHQVYTKPHLFVHFRELYESYSDGDKINMQLLLEEYHRACRYVISVADVIGATPSICAEK